MNLRKSYLFIVCFLLGCLLCFSCANKKKKEYFIAVDPSWFPLETYGKEPYLLAFTSELLKLIGEYGGVSLTRVNTPWDALLEGLTHNKYDAILNSMQPYVFNLEKYSFSENMLLTGPVLVIQKELKFSSHDKLKEKEIAVFSEDDSEILMQYYPESFPRQYDQVSLALKDVISGSMDGALLSSIEASSYVSDIYNDRLKIATKPLTEDGIKLITLKKEHQDLIDIFNKGLTHLKENGVYAKLLKKWKVGYLAWSK